MSKEITWQQSVKHVDALGLGTILSSAKTRDTCMSTSTHGQIHAWTYLGVPVEAGLLLLGLPEGAHHYHVLTFRQECPDCCVDGLGMCCRPAKVDSCFAKTGWYQARFTSRQQNRASVSVLIHERPCPPALM